MKPLHLIKSDNVRAYADHAQVINSHVIVTDVHLLVKLPAEDVFGENVITPEDHFYINVREWQRFKFDKAASISRDGLKFTAFDKKGRLGEVTAISADEYLEKAGIRYPNTEVVWPKGGGSDISFIGVDIDILSRAVNIAVPKAGKVKLKFHGIDKVVTIDVWDASQNKVSKTKVLIVSVLTEGW